jgi:Tol biopolymer transport system component
MVHPCYKILSLWLICISVLVSACTTAPGGSPEVPVTLVIFDSLPQPTSSPTSTRKVVLPAESTAPTSFLERQLTPSPSPTHQTTTSVEPAGTTQPVPPTRTRFPMKTSDLLFLSNDRLMRWDRVTNYTGILAENVIDYAASDDGQTIAMLRTRNRSANGVQVYNLDILDFETKQIHTLLEGSPPLFHLSISSNGDWVAYMPQDGVGQILALSTHSTGSPISLGECRPQNELHCLQIAWSPSDPVVIWSDLNGVWFATVKGGEPRLVLSNQVDVSDPEGRVQTITVTFDKLLWSPVGRVAMVQVIPSLEGVHWLALLDTLRGTLINIPDTSEYGSPSIGVLWTAGSSLLITNPGDPVKHISPFAKLWDVVVTRNDLLNLSLQIDLQTSDLPALMTGPAGRDSYAFSSLFQSDEVTFPLVLASLKGNLTPALYFLSLKDGSLGRILELPGDLLQVSWSPDKSGALIVTQQSQFFFAPMDGSQIVELGGVFGPDAHHFQWLPPASRS